MDTEAKVAMVLMCAGVAVLLYAGYYLIVGLALVAMAVTMIVSGDE